MNEAALLAARRDADAVAVEDFEAAIERVIAGLEKRTRVMSDETRLPWHIMRLGMPWWRSWCNMATR